ncbi:glycosyltransferase family 4 protein [Halorientalis regularis]|uniref:Glycosyl transferases group 1 n=1 Tax=Halorientalis regularis TaxID=660518 RepID=A0A1G7T313_9EURY|nr:glycosyltransferase family 4 protein [Halorientalis regularis]SDG29716.1 Glycosyl transferases group 1 [Halorientalis regularis]
MTDRLAFFVGSTTPFNVRLDVQHYVWMLRERFDIDLVATDFSGFSSAVLADVAQHGATHASNRPGEYRAVREYLDAHDPAALVHVTRSALPPSVVAGAAKSNGVPVVYRYGSDELYTYRVASGWRKAGYFFRNNVLGRAMLRLSDVQMVFGPTAKRRLTSRGCEPDNVVELPPPFDPGRLTMDGDSSAHTVAPRDRDLVLFVGRRIRYKGFDYLVERIPELIESRPSLHFAFVGGGDRDPELPPPADDHVTVVGEVEPEFMGAYFDAADLLVHPTLTEAFGRVIVEAQLAGTRTLARDVGDVAVATENTFETDQEFVDSVVSFEDLSLEDGTRFDRAKLKPEYVSFFERLTAR